MPIKYKALSGKKINMLTLLSWFYDKNKLYYYCICDCGNEKNIFAYSIVNNNTKSCGCYKISRRFTHGKSKTPEYSVWQSMRNRCKNKNLKVYKDYGGRGITVCKRWNNFENFLEDMGERPSNNHSLDRINNNKGYYASNCRWTDASTQANNRRGNKYYFRGKFLTASQISRLTGVKRSTLAYRLNKKGEDIERAIRTQGRNYNS